MAGHGWPWLTLTVQVTTTRVRTKVCDQPPGGFKSCTALLAKAATIWRCTRGKAAEPTHASQAARQAKGGPEKNKTKVRHCAAPRYNGRSIYPTNGRPQVRKRHPRRKRGARPAKRSQGPRGRARPDTPADPAQALGIDKPGFRKPGFENFYLLQGKWDVEN